MGGRGAWSIVLNSTGPFAGMAAVAGELDAFQLASPTALDTLIQSRLPIRHHHGSLVRDECADYADADQDTSSTQSAFNQTTDALIAAAKRVDMSSQLLSTTHTGLDHTAMQYAAWDDLLLRWLLAQSACGARALD